MTSKSGLSTYQCMIKEESRRARVEFRAKRALEDLRFEESLGEPDAPCLAKIRFWVAAWEKLAQAYGPLGER